LIVAGTMATIWRYVVIHQQRGAEEVVTAVQQLGSLVTAPTIPAEQGPPRAFYLWFAGIAAVLGKKQVGQATPAAPEKAIAGVKQDVEAVKGHH